MSPEETDRTKGTSIVPRADELAFLETSRVARFATLGQDHAPHIVPTCYACNVAEGVLTAIDIALDEKPKRVAPGRLRRVQNLTANPSVSILIDRYDDDDWGRLAFLRVDGQARLVEPGAGEHAPAVAVLRAKYPQYRAMALAERPIIRVTPTALSSWGALVAKGEGLPSRALPFATLVKARRSVRRFRPDPVPRAIVEELIAAAGWAPSPHGRQPWRFAVITRPAAREALADAMGATWTAQLVLDGQERAIVEARLEGSRQRLLTTPTLIIPCLYTADLDHYPDPDRQAAEETMAIQSLGAAIQNLLLAATAHSLDTGWMCAPLFCSEVVRDTLGLAADLVPHALIQVGWAAQDPRRRDRLPLTQLIAQYDLGPDTARFRDSLPDDRHN